MFTKLLAGLVLGLICCMSCNKKANQDIRLVKGTILRQVDSTPYGNTTFKIHSNPPRDRFSEAVNNIFTTDSQGKFAVTHTFKNTSQQVYVAWPDGDEDADGVGGFPYRCFMVLPYPRPGAKGDDLDLGTIYAPEP